MPPPQLWPCSCPLPIAVEVAIFPKDISYLVTSLLHSLHHWPTAQRWPIRVSSRPRPGPLKTHLQPTCRYTALPTYTPAALSFPQNTASIQAFIEAIPTAGNALPPPQILKAIQLKTVTSLGGEPSPGASEELTCLFSTSSTQGT